MRFLILMTICSFLIGCNPILNDVSEAEKYCQDKGGVSKFARWHQVICKDGSYVM